MLCEMPHNNNVCSDLAMQPVELFPNRIKIIYETSQCVRVEARDSGLTEKTLLDLISNEATDN